MDRLIKLALFIFLFLFFLKIPVDPDLGWHLRNGQKFVSELEVVGRESFTHTIEGSVVNHTEWLSDIMHYLLFREFSFIGLGVLSSFIISIALLFPFILFRTPVILSIPFTLLTAFISDKLFSVGLRSQNWGFLFTSIIASLMFYSLKKRQGKVMFLIIPLFALWINMHPSYAIGLPIFLLLFLYIFSQIQGKINIYFKVLFVFFAFLAIAVITYVVFIGVFPLDLVKGLFFPAKYAIYQTESGSIRVEISEWLPPLVADLRVTLNLFLIIFSFYIFRPVANKIKSWILFIYVLFISYFSMLASRNITFFIAAVMPALAWKLDGYILKIPSKKFIIIKVVSALYLAVFSFILLSNNKLLSVKLDFNSPYFCDRSYPCKAIEYLKKEKPAGFMFNHYNWGGYLIWNLPEYPVFIDGRFPGTKLYEEYKKVTDLSDNWEEILDKYRVKIILMPKNKLWTEKVLEKGWILTYDDDSSQVLLKNNE